MFCLFLSAGNLPASKGRAKYENRLCSAVHRRARDSYQTRFSLFYLFQYFCRPSLFHYPGFTDRHRSIVQITCYISNFCSSPLKFCSFFLQCTKYNSVFCHRPLHRCLCRCKFWSLGEQLAKVIWGIPSRQFPKWSLGGILQDTQEQPLAWASRDL